MSNELVVFGTYNDIEIHARSQDTFIDVTELCQTHGKDWYEYARSVGATRFLEALSAGTEISRSSLIIKTGGTGGHTFVDRRIALHCAAWIDAKFEVWVYDQIEKIVASAKNLFEEQMNALCVVSGAIGTCVGQGFKETVGRLTTITNQIVKIEDIITNRIVSIEAAVVDAEQRLTQKLEELVEHPKARRPFGGPLPDTLKYFDIRPALYNMSQWHNGEFGGARQTFWDGLYITVMKELNFNPETHRTTYVRQLRVLINNPHYLTENVPLVEVCEQYGILRQVYQIAWRLTNGGTTSFPFPDKKAVDEVAYPVTLETRGERKGQQLYPAWVYMPYGERSVGRKRQRNSEAGNATAAAAEAEVNKYHEEKAAAQKAEMKDRLDKQADVCSGSMPHADAPEAALKDLHAQKPQQQTDKVSEPFLAAHNGN